MNAAGRDEHVPEPGDPVGELSYMAASRELDSIVEFFERSEVDVDQLVARLERATAIVDELDRRIRRTRAQVEELVPKLEAVGRTTPEATADDEEDDGAPDESMESPGDEFVDRSPAVGAEETASSGDTLPF